MLAVEYNGARPSSFAGCCKPNGGKRCALERAGVSRLEIGQFEKQRLQHLLSESVATPVQSEPEPATAKSASL
ncbi:hypothetical protein QBD00_004139 [Ochrobactrum sp. AN78]|nr:hypothetical protein [Ochrobactrum sp. AN78]